MMVQPKVESLVTGWGMPIELILGGLGAKVPFASESTPTVGEQIRKSARDEKLLAELLSWIQDPQQQRGAPQPMPQGADFQKAQQQITKAKQNVDKSQSAVEDIQSKIRKLTNEQGVDVKDEIAALNQRLDRKKDLLADAQKELEQSNIRFEAMRLVSPGGYMEIERGPQKPVEQMSVLEAATAMPGQEVMPGTYGAPPGQAARVPMGAPLQNQAASILEALVQRGGAAPVASVAPEMQARGALRGVPPAFQGGAPAYTPTDIDDMMATLGQMVEAPEKDDRAKSRLDKVTEIVSAIAGKVIGKGKKPKKKLTDEERLDLQRQMLALMWEPSGKTGSERIKMLPETQSGLWPGHEWPGLR